MDSVRSVAAPPYSVDTRSSGWKVKEKIGLAEALPRPRAPPATGDIAPNGERNAALQNNSGLDGRRCPKNRGCESRTARATKLSAKKQRDQRPERLLARPCLRSSRGLSVTLTS
jgi:hypothetical protein